MSKKLMLFRLACVVFIITNFIISFKMETEADVILMAFNFMFTIALLIAEVKCAFDGAKHNA